MSLRYIGDVLLSTPLALSIKERFPEASVDFLVFAGTEGILAKNPLVRNVHTVKAGSKNLGLVRALWKKYDYSIGVNASDRTAIFTAVSGRCSIGFSSFLPKEWWKKLILTHCRLASDRTHLVPISLTQLEPLGIPPHARVVMAYDGDDASFARDNLGDAPYVVLHPYSRQKYKYWTVEEWGALAGLIKEKLGLRPIFTRSPNPDDSRVLEEILANAPAGTGAFHTLYTMNQLAAAIAGSRGYVGVDTVVTHMAAALDVPTVALFGPTMSRYWAPWPNGSADISPFAANRGTQRVANIAKIQQEWDCVPCNGMSCAMGTGDMECLVQLTAEQVFAQLALLLGKEL